MRISIALAMLTATCGCAAAPGSQLESCDAAKAQSLVGRPATAAAAAEAKRLAGARVVRWLQPGQIITMEYSAGRLNLVLDKRNRIEAIRCG